MASVVHPTVPEHPAAFTPELFDVAIYHFCQGRAAEFVLFDLTHSAR